ncbi:hypothetical protein [Streptomyces sp. WAC06614]|uniref:hypothetical protein n=1 Tax=Streptomyces sp. WAC06614 TaxID=2487416 RepID=UPI000F7B6342|nr:hypothetical protein [Streptomyces sp. WAC06614]RSS72812.1 hypothetical protein EF918_26095 [Streptomyces sp. WAC06614]
MAFVPSVAGRIHLAITFVLVTCGVLVGACLGFLAGGRTPALVAATAAGVGAGAGALLARRQVLAHLRPAGGTAGRPGGYTEGVSDAVRVSIAMYQAAVFPLTPGGVGEEERAARRTVAYRLAAFDGLPLAVRLSAAAALEALDQGTDPERAQAAMKALSLTVYEHRGTAGP